MMPLKQVCDGLLLRPLRSLLSTLGICFGVMALVAMLSIGEGAKQQTLQRIRALGTRNIVIRATSEGEENLRARQSAVDGLSWSDAELLQRALPVIASAVPLRSIDSPIEGGELLAVGAELAQLRGWVVRHGRFLTREDLRQRREVCVIGRDLAAQLGIQSIGERLRIENSLLTVVGMLHASSDSSVSERDPGQLLFVPFGVHHAFADAQQRDPQQIDELTLQVQQGVSVPAVADAVERLLLDAHGGQRDFQLIVPELLLRQARATQQTFNWVLGGIAALSLLVGGIGIMNIMLATVSERTKEIGIRRALGATQRAIIQQFLLETCLLALAGACIGLLGGAGIAVAVALIAGWPTVVTFLSILLSLVMALGVGLCSGLYPAYTAARLDPVQALRA